HGTDHRHLGDRQPWERRGRTGTAERQPDVRPSGRRRSHGGRDLPVKLPEGYTTAGIGCGLKPSGNLDLGLLVSDRPAVAAGVFTTNRVQAAPVQLTRRHIRRGTARAIVANAGNANACTGKQGYADARAMAEQTARALATSKEKVLVNSTGIIGVPLDMEKVRRGVDAAATALSDGGAGDFAAAIMTTDTRPKTAEATRGSARIAG